MIVKTIFREMDTLKANFENCKAYFPRMSKKLIGSQQFNTAPRYWHKGFPVTFSSNKPLTAQDVKKNNEISHWLNENFAVRLYAILNSYNIVSEKVCIDKSIDGWKDVDLLRRLRHVIAHNSGRYNPEDKEDRKLLTKIISHFNLDNANRKAFPLAINTVLDPLFEGCKRYVQEKVCTPSLQPPTSQ